MGYTIINNEILEDERLNIQEQSLLITLISYYNKEKGYAYPSYKQLMKRSKIKSKTTFINTLNSLINNKYINRQTVKGKGCRYYINGAIPSTDIDQVQICTKSKNVPIPSTDIDQHQVQICTTTNTNTNTNTNTIYDEIFNLYVKQNIINHKKITKDMIKAIDKALKKFSSEEIKLSITRYGIMYKDGENYYAKKYCKYRWTLKEFLTRENGISEFLDEGGKWIRYKDLEAKTNLKDIEQERTNEALKSIEYWKEGAVNFD